MRINYPAPVSALPKDMLLQEHHWCLEVSTQMEQLLTGKIQEADVHPEVLRWKNYPVGLYDRYRQSLELLSHQMGIEVIDVWPEECLPAEGAFIIYPDDSQETIEDIWTSVFVAVTRMEY